MAEAMYKVHVVRKLTKNVNRNTHTCKVLFFRYAFRHKHSIPTHIRNRYVFMLVALLVPFIGAGQSIFLQESYSSFRCTGSVMSVSFTASGTFAAGNTFRVQLLANYGSTYIDLPGSFTSSPALVTLPASFVPGRPCVYRLVTDKSLRVSSSGSSFRIGTRPTAKVTGSTADNIPINPYTSTNLRIAVTGGATCTLPMRDSTR